MIMLLTCTEHNTKFLFGDSSGAGLISITLFDMRFFGTFSLGEHNFVVYAPVITKSRTVMELDVFYTVVTKTFVTSLPLHNYNVITCINADA